MTTLHGKLYILASAWTTDSFVTTYYSLIDRNRSHLPDLYRSTSKVVRNGAGFVGTDSLRTYLSSLPPTTHIVTSYNCHPLPVTTISPQAQPNEQHSLPSSLITVTGTVKFGGEGFERPFTQTFIINPDLNPTQEQQEKLGDVQLFYIGSDTLRIHDQ